MRLYINTIIVVISNQVKMDAIGKLKISLTKKIEMRKEIMDESQSHQFSESEESISEIIKQLMPRNKKPSGTSKNVRTCF